MDQSDQAKVIIDRCTLFLQKHRDTLFRRVGYLLPIAFIGLMAFDALTAQNGQSDFLNSRAGSGIVGALMVLCGAHLLVFKDEWVQHNVNYAKRRFEKHPRWCFGLRQQQTSPEFHRGLLSLAGPIIVILGTLLFLEAISR